MADPSSGALTLEGVRLAFPGLDVRYDLVAPPGVTAVIGPSGAGKSTLLDLIAGFATPDAGEIRLGAERIDALPPAERPVTTLFQDHNLFAHHTVAANVGLGLRPALRLPPEEREAVAAALAEVGLHGFADRMPATLSGGERQRVALARALVRRRPVLLLDEPFAALGPAMRRDLVDLVVEKAAARGLVALLVSHDPEDALRAAPRTLYVEAGEVRAEGETARLLAGGVSPALDAYLGLRDPRA